MYGIVICIRTSFCEDVIQIPKKKKWIWIHWRSRFFFLSPTLTNLVYIISSNNFEIIYIKKQTNNSIRILGNPLGKTRATPGKIISGFERVFVNPPLCPNKTIQSIEGFSFCDLDSVASDSLKANQWRKNKNVRDFKTRSHSCLRTTMTNLWLPQRNDPRLPSTTRNKIK